MLYEVITSTTVGYMKRGERTLKGSSRPNTNIRIGTLVRSSVAMFYILC